MRQPSSLRLYEYWNELRGSDPAPERSQLDPNALSSILADTFILQIDHWKSLPLRLVGSRTNSLFARELKGYPFIHLFTLASRPEIKSAVEWISKEAHPIVSGLTGHAPGNRAINLELLLLPLLHDKRLDQRILGSLSLIDKPEWIGLIALDHLEMRSFRILNHSDRFTRSPLTRALSHQAPSPKLVS